MLGKITYLFIQAFAEYLATPLPLSSDGNLLALPSPWFSISIEST
jgi:hypothetical protein